MKRLVCASTNPVKVRATLAGFERMFPQERFEIEPVPVPSGVSVQPRSSGETLRGAENRARGAMGSHPQASFWVGIEGGVEETEGDMEAFAWVVVLAAEGWGRSRSGSFLIPTRVAELVRGGMELGPADDRVFGKTNSKQKQGAIGLLTGDVIDRTALYEHAVILALVSFKNAPLYASSEHRRTSWS